MKIERQKRIEGTTISGIIENGGYHFTHVEIYQDGLINAWDLEDLNSMETRLQEPRLQVVTEVPPGKLLSIFGLGSYQILSANWAHTPASYLELIKAKVAELNPRLENLYTFSEEERALWKERKIGLSAKSKVYHEIPGWFYDTEVGEAIPFFFKKDDENYLVRVAVFKSGLVQVACSAFEWTLDIAEVKTRFHAGDFFTEFQEPLVVHLGELGVATIGHPEHHYPIELEDKIEELFMAHERLNGKDRFQICRDAYHAYLEYPEDFYREELRKAYLAIPEHERMYLGDMDSKDGDYRRILFSDEKREV
ncbi:DUF7638 domain-containing protein [Listeria costaricensis]|uniref:DUF7638 domain-containing protein n=1 Tax=Listeria costaricensis TaxID=2026604 RepID=UPI000C08A92E|nr:hypothetical protein [Listeria costaricensis]